MTQSWGSYIYYFSCFSIALLGVGLCVIHRYQGTILYVPNFPARYAHDNPTGYRSPKDVGIPEDRCTEKYINTEDDEILHSYHLTTRLPSETVVVYFHGNAGNSALRLPSAMELVDEVHVDVLLVDYRGYGSSSQATITEEGLRTDAKAVLQYLKKNEQYTRIIIFGRSLGGAVAIAAAVDNPCLVSAIIVENTFLSISHVIDNLLGIISPLKHLVLNLRWESIHRAPLVTCPVLLISGLQDELVPPWHMRHLHGLFTASSGPVTLHTIANGSHNDTFIVGGKRYFSGISEFLSKVHIRKDTMIHEKSD